MQRISVVSSYLNALAANDESAILSHFSQDATVVSPSYGVMAAVPFYKKLCADTARVAIIIRGIFPSAADPSFCTAYFDYTWELAAGEKKQLEILDLFQIIAGRITFLRIFADASKNFDAAILSSRHE